MKKNKIEVVMGTATLTGQVVVTGVSDAGVFAVSRIDEARTLAALDTALN